MPHTKKITTLLISMLVLANIQLYAGRDEFISTPRMIAGLAITSFTCIIGLFGYIIQLHRKIKRLETHQPDITQQIHKLEENAGKRLQVDYHGVPRQLEVVLNLKADFADLEERETRLNNKLRAELNSFQVLRTATEQQTSKKEIQEIETEAPKYKYGNLPILGPTNPGADTKQPDIK